MCIRGSGRPTWRRSVGPRTGESTTETASAVTLGPGGSYPGGRGGADKAPTLPAPGMMSGMLGAKLGS